MGKKKRMRGRTTLKKYMYNVEFWQGYICKSNPFLSKIHNKREVVINS